MNIRLRSASSRRAAMRAGLLAHLSGEAERRLSADERFADRPPQGKRLSRADVMEGDQAPAEGAEDGSAGSEYP